ncbi:beta-1,6-N-acetylglucosaminyltransferase [Blautia coccoides]|uniref:beta-1,6-N-acetylglucosaminyltransferase n=1 Tax=Blautia producta TaxID=33035 RepID=UPI0028A4001B|nr:beta-1,6-N-acetylglucosaminyltransferase [Blautia coccoides]MDT4373494.1 beta-1,6-N-acetylglucosaminyltransferase [Blautia coccoides]
MVICHDQPELLRRVAQVLMYGEDKLFVHVDKKVDIKPFLNATAELTNVVFIDNRIENYWGGFNSIIATMELIRAVLSNGKKFDRIVLLQGKDYPLHSPAYIHAFFQKHKSEEFCKAKNISISKKPRDYMKCCGYWYQDHKGRMYDKLIVRALGIFNTKLKIKYRSPFFKDGTECWDVYKGWAQFALTAECAEYVLSVYDSNLHFNRYMKHRFPPDEIYVHTILYNSLYKERISTYSLIPRKASTWKSSDLNLTYFEYPTTVTVFKNRNIFIELNGTNALFFRKAVLPESTELLDEIDVHIKREEILYESNK